MNQTKPSFRADLERAAQDGTEWKVGAVETDLAAVPLDARLIDLPAGVLQYNNIMDTNGCASRAPLNILETKLDYFYANGMHPALKDWFDQNGYRVNGKFALCDAFIEILSGTTPTGNSLKAPLETIRTFGVIPASLIPLQDGMTWPEYMNPSRITRAHKDLGAQFLRRLTIAYEQVPSSQFAAEWQNDLLDVAGFAWPTPVNGIYPRTEGEPFNHAFAAVDATIHAFDNYDPFVKQLAPDYEFFDWGYSLSITNQNPYPDEEIALFDVLKQAGLLAFFAEALRRLIATYAPETSANVPVAAPDAPVTPPVAPVPPTTPTAPQEQPKSRILDWAAAIQVQEGWHKGSRSYANNNPGNIKWSAYTKTLGANGPDIDGFCVFPSYTAGFEALCQFLEDACRGELKSYTPAMSLMAFTETYAQPPNNNYANGVAQQLGVSVLTPIKDLLTPPTTAAAVSVAPLS